ncbi:hypothetical protein LCGC14_0768570 [marine sediment metagenome]|uniref:Uncharacterized protein n=1 Tax=marine sediment metagenome TaxID=412755 RepID=A0A0F9Q366_9ZZZZ
MHNKLDISFTGTQHRDLTTRQCFDLTNYLIEYRAALRSIHLGDCIMADEQMFTIVQETGLEHLVILHPPSDARKRAYCPVPAQRIMPPRPYLQRNRDMAAACDVMLAAPKQEGEVVRSGTWATVRYARQLSKQVIIFNP